jgi:hypothetical protein
LGKEWTFAISDRLQIHFEMVDRADPTKYSLNLSGLIDGEWTALVRYDNSHQPCHRHIFYPDESPSEHTFLAVVPATFFGQAQRELKMNAVEYLEEYERRLANMTRGD